METTDPAPAPIASKEPEKGKRYFGLYLLMGGLNPYDMESDIETATALAKTMEVSNHTIWNPIIETTIVLAKGRIAFVVLVSLVPLE